MDALSKWVGHIPEDVVADMAEVAPMLKTMGYDPNGNPPKYGDADKEVIENTNNIKMHSEEWEKQGELVKQKSKNFHEGEDIGQVNAEDLNNVDSNIQLFLIPSNNIQ